MTSVSYVIAPRSAALGGGWNLKLYTHPPGTERIVEGGGVFPLTAECDSQTAYQDAVEVGNRWVEQHGPMPKLENHVLMFHAGCIGVIVGPLSDLTCAECGAKMSRMVSSEQESEVRDVPLPTNAVDETAPLPRPTAEGSKDRAD